MESAENAMCFHLQVNILGGGGKQRAAAVDLNKSSQTYFLFSFALHAALCKERKENIRAKKMNRAAIKVVGVAKWDLNVTDAIASAKSRCKVFA